VAVFSSAVLLKNKRAYSNGPVVDASSVEQKRRYANGRIVVCGVKVKRSSTYSGIEAALVVPKSEYKPIRYLQHQW